MKCQRGYCIVCEKVIATPCKDCGVGYKNNEFYTEVQIPWSNGAKMQVATCTACAKSSIWEADKMAMTEAIWEAWDKQGGTYDRSIVIV